MFNTNNNNITPTTAPTTLSSNIDNTVPAQNEPQYARYSVSHTDILPPDPQLNQFIRGFSIFNNNMIFSANNNNGTGNVKNAHNNFTSNYNNIQSYQNQQILPALNQDIPAFNTKYRLSSIPSSITTINNNNNKNDNINLNDVYLNNNTINQNNIVFNSSIFNSNQSADTDNSNNTNTGNNTDNTINISNGGELFNANLNTILDTSLNAGSNLNFINPKRKSSILFMDSNDLKSFDWTYPTANNTNGNNNFNPLSFNNYDFLNNEKTSSMIPKDLDSNKLFADSNSSSNTITSTSTNITANTDDIDPLSTQPKDFIKLNPYGSFSNYNNNTSNNNNIIIEKSRSNSYSKRNSSLNNLLFGDKMTIPVINTESIDNYLEGNNSDKTTSPTTTITTDSLNILSPASISPLLNEQNTLEQTNNKKKRAVKKNKLANIEKSMLIKEEQSNAHTPFYDKSETPLGETRIDQLMLMLQARQKGITDEIKTDKEGELLLDENPNIVPDKKILAGGITKRKDRDISTLSPIQKDIILSRPISGNQSDSESILKGLLKSDSELNSTKINLTESIDQDKLNSNIPLSPNTSNENNLNITGLNNFFNIEELSSEEKQLINRNVCPYCQHVFKQSTHLQVHLRSHLGYKPFKCRFCEKRFTQGGNLRTHEKLHTGLRPYECHICKRKFSRKGNLKAHMFTHNDTKPFICRLENCNKTFTQLGNMKAHQNRFHKNTVLHLTNILAKWNPQTDDMPEHDRQLLEYFASLYKNSNKGIKGRGKGNANIKLIPGLDHDHSLPSTNSEVESDLEFNNNNNNNNGANSSITADSTNLNANNHVSPLQSMTTNLNFNNLEGNHMPISYKNDTSNYTTTPKNNNLSNTSKGILADTNPKSDSASTFLPMMVSKFKDPNNSIKVDNKMDKNNDIDINGIYQEAFDKNNVNINMVKPSNTFPDYFLLDDTNSNNNTAYLKNENNKNMFMVGKDSASVVPSTTEIMTSQKRKNNLSSRRNENKRQKKKSLQRNETNDIISNYVPSMNINSQSIDFKKLNYKT